jgi:hypothetical protein
MAIEWNSFGTLSSATMLEEGSIVISNGTDSRYTMDNNNDTDLLDKAVSLIGTVVEYKNGNDNSEPSANHFSDIRSQ